MRLLGHGIIKPDSRSAAAPSTTASTSDARPRTEPNLKRVIIEICCSEDSHSQDIDGVWLGKGDFPDTCMKQSDKALEVLGKMMSFMLRGWASDRDVTHLNFDPNDGSVDFAEFYDALSERWNGLAVWKIVEVTSRNTKGRYEIFGSAKDDATRRGLVSNWDLLKIRAVQGHNSKGINEDADPLKITVRQYAL